MAKTLRIGIIIATQYGQTAKIAEAIARTIRESGADVQTVQIKQTADIAAHPPSDFDALIVGGPIYVGKFPQVLVDYVKTYIEVLNSMSVACFSVSLNAADVRPEARREDERLIREFLEKTGLKVDRTVSLIGAVHYRKYGFFKRWMLRRICAKAGGPTDTSRDHELTDWAAVTAFARVAISGFEARR